MILPLSIRQYSQQYIQVSNIRGFIRITYRHSFIAPFGVSFLKSLCLPLMFTLLQCRLLERAKVKTNKSANNKKNTKIPLSFLSRILRGDYRVNPNVVSWIKLLIAIVLSLLYVLNGDIDGLLRLLIEQTLQGFCWCPLFGHLNGYPFGDSLRCSLRGNPLEKLNIIL